MKKTTYQAINVKNDRILEIDDRTALWLARMLVGESGSDCTYEHASAMFWALLNRWFLHKYRKNWKNFLYMVRAFSQPINPRWQRNGDLAKKYKSSEKKLKRRSQICRLKWSQIDKINPEYWHFVDHLQRGVLEVPEYIPFMVTNWAQSTKKMKNKYPEGIDICGNWFIEDEEIDEGYVVINHWI